MSDSVWLFGCRLGLAQGTCRNYNKDHKSRGTSYRMRGCASCKYRTPDNHATTSAEAAHANAA